MLLPVRYLTSEQERRIIPGQPDSYAQCCWNTGYERSRTEHGLDGEVKTTMVKWTEIIYYCMNACSSIENFLTRKLFGDHLSSQLCY